MASEAGHGMALPSRIRQVATLAVAVCTLQATVMTSVSKKRNICTAVTNFSEILLQLVM